MLAALKEDTLARQAAQSVHAIATADSPEAEGATKVGWDKIEGNALNNFDR